MKHTRAGLKGVDAGHPSEVQHQATKKQNKEEGRLHIHTLACIQWDRDQGDREQGDREQVGS